MTVPVLLSLIWVSYSPVQRVAPRAEWGSKHGYQGCAQEEAQGQNSFLPALPSTHWLFLLSQILGLMAAGMPLTPGGEITGFLSCKVAVKGREIVSFGALGQCWCTCV